MKSYRQQFVDCSRHGYTDKTETYKLKDYSKPTENKYIAIDVIMCGRFGGRCNNHNENCMKLRKEEYDNLVYRSTL